MEIICEEDCGNAPKKLLLKDFNVAIVKCDLDPIVNNITDDIHWSLIGLTSVQGKDEFIQTVQEMEREKPKELNIKNIITHGNTGAVNGSIVTQEKTYAFCDVYKFSGFKNPKIKEISSYIIRLDKKQL